MDLHQRADATLNKLTKWRSVFAGWQLGTRSKTDPESQAVRDHREVTILLRVEGSAIAGLLIEKGVFTAEEFTERLIKEAEHLDESFEGRFPGMKSTPDGISYDLAVIQACGTMKNWRP